MQGDLRVYDSDDFFCYIAGIPLDGYADGEWLRVERDSPSFEDVVGTDGEVTRSKTNDDRATVTLRLMQTSQANLLLSTLHASDKNTPGGVGVGPFLLTNVHRGGSTNIVAEKCWISKEPDISMDRTATEREWTIRLAKLVSIHGS